MISQDKVNVIIGLIASLEHVATRSVTTPAHELLIYTTYYEGGVCERTFFATGQVAFSPSAARRPARETQTARLAAAAIKARFVRIVDILRAGSSG